MSDTSPEKSPTTDDNTQRPHNGRTVSLDLVKHIMEDALERQSEIEQKVKTAMSNLGVNSLFESVREFNEAVGISSIQRFAEQVASTHKAIERSMAPFTADLSRITQLANQVAPSMAALERLGEATKLPLMQDVVRAQEQIALRTKAIMEMVDITALRLPDELFDQHEETAIPTPVRTSRPEITEEQLRSSVILSATVTARTVIEETKARTLPSYRKAGDIIGVHLPDKMDWYQLTIKFMDGHTVRITHEDNPTDPSFRTYKEMGFDDARKDAPNIQWELLRDLADGHGIMTWKSPKASDKVKKRKEILARALIYYFGIKSDPFELYKQEGGYKIKINLTPDSGVPHKRIATEDDIMDGVEEIFNGE